MNIILSIITAKLIKVNCTIKIWIQDFFKTKYIVDSVFSNDLMYFMKKKFLQSEEKQLI